MIDPEMRRITHEWRWPPEPVPEVPEGYVYRMGRLIPREIWDQYLSRTRRSEGG